MKFAVERERLTIATNELTAITRRVVQECLLFMKAQNLEIQCENPDAMKIMGVDMQIDPVVDAVFPNVKASVLLKCSGSTRSIK